MCKNSILTQKQTYNEDWTNTFKNGRVNNVEWIDCTIACKKKVGEYVFKFSAL